MRFPPTLLISIGVLFCAALPSEAQQSALARRLERDATIVMVTPTLRDAAASGAQPAPDPVIYAVASKEGTTVRARAGYFFSPGLFGDVTMSSPVTISRALAITEDGLAQGTSIAGRIHKFFLRRCSHGQAMASCANKPALEQTVSQYQAAISARPLSPSLKRSERRQILDSYLADVATGEQRWIKQTFLFTLTADGARPTTQYFDTSATGPLKRQDWTNAFGLSVGMAAQKKPAGSQVQPHYYLGGSVSRAKQLVGPGSASFCYPVASSVATQCSTLATAEPQLDTGVVAKIEARYWLTRNLAAAVEFTRDAIRRETSVQVPLQVFQSKASVDDPLGAAGGTASGGLLLEWKRTPAGGSRFLLAAYVGTAFQLPQAPTTP